ncbi:MAG: ABC transporter substrate-binding protein [Christensenellales bacterium]|jgi:sn-glycerol 3-phosphate transport system substrate-binding protein|nr:ABC transporter substrate-binding protein [Clostridiales bacterium]
MKRILTLILALALCLGLVGGVSASDKRTVTFWHCFGGTIGEALQATVDAFNASQDEIFVDASFQGAYDDTLTKLKAAFPAGTAPDVFQMFELGTCYLAGTDYVIPFQDMLDKDPYISLDKVEGVLRNYYTVDGKMMCIPLNPSSPVMYYNKDAFAKAGITEVPTTFKEIEAIAEKLTAPEGNPKYAMGLSIYGWFFENLLAGANHYYTNNENGRAGVSTAIEYDTNGGGALVLESWKRLVDEGICFNFGVDNAGSAAAFIAGDTAITFESTAQLTTITNGAEFEVGAAYLPSVLDESIGGVLIGGANLWLTKQDDDQKVQDAWEFIKFATSAEPAAKFSMATGYFAANTTAYEVPAYVEHLEKNPNANVALQQLHDSPLNNVTAGAFVGVMGELRQIWQSSMELYLQGAFTTEEALEDMASQSNSAIEYYNQTAGK